MQTRWKKCCAVVVSASLLITAAAAAQAPGGSPLDGGLPPGGLPPLSPPRTEWPSRAVNTPKGEQCPALFENGAGLCFPVATAAEVLRYLTVEYPRAWGLTLLQPQQEAIRQGMAAATRTWQAAYESEQAVSAARAAQLALANQQIETLVKSAKASDSWWSGFGATVLSFLSGAAIATGITWAVRK